MLVLVVVVMGGEVSFIDGMLTDSSDLGVLVQVANDGVLLQQVWNHCSLGRLLNESAQGAIAEQAVLECLPAGPVDALSRVAAGQADQALQQTVGTHTALDDDLLGPGQRLRPDVFGL